MDVCGQGQPSLQSGFCGSQGHEKKSCLEKPSQNQSNKSRSGGKEIKKKRRKRREERKDDITLPVSPFLCHSVIVSSEEFMSLD